MAKPYSIKVGEALDSLTNGKGFGKKEMKIMGLVDAIPEIVFWAKQVCARWEKGDLAEAVRNLDWAVQGAENHRITKKLLKKRLKESPLKRKEKK